MSGRPDALLMVYLCVRVCVSACIFCVCIESLGSTHEKWDENQKLLWTHTRGNVYMVCVLPLLLLISPLVTDMIQTRAWELYNFKLPKLQMFSVKQSRAEETRLYASNVKSKWKHNEAHKSSTATL